MKPNSKKRRSISKLNSAICMALVGFPGLHTAGAHPMDQNNYTYKEWKSTLTPVPTDKVKVIIVTKNKVKEQCLTQKQCEDEKALEIIQKQKTPGITEFGIIF
jgi:hypothetical protein